MSYDSPAKPATSTKLVIRNIGLLLSGDLDRPILDADTVVAIDGVIQVVGREKDVDELLARRRPSMPRARRWLRG